ncbi:MAG: type I 3-dehydroquinate dehydratase [Fervidicoccaceae archaeon]
MEGVRGGAKKINPVRAICTVLAAENFNELKRLAESLSTAMAELRLDYLLWALGEQRLPLEDVMELAERLKRRGVEVIVTLRERSEGGLYSGSPVRKAEIVAELSSAVGVAADLELSYERVSDVASELKRRGAKLIVSSHELSSALSRDDLRSRILRGFRLGADVVKVVYRASRIEDNIAALEACAMFSGRVVSFCVGRLGVVSRILSPLFGAPFTYAYPAGGTPTAEGQLTVEELVRVWTKLGLAEERST